MGPQGILAHQEQEQMVGGGGCCLEIPTNSAGMGASLVAQTVKNLPAVQETQVQSLNWEDPLEEDMATHSSILA